MSTLSLTTAGLQVQRPWRFHDIVEEAPGPRRFGTSSFSGEFCGVASLHKWTMVLAECVLCRTTELNVVAQLSLPELCCGVSLELIYFCSSITLDWVHWLCVGEGFCYMLWCTLKGFFLVLFFLECAPFCPLWISFSDYVFTIFPCPNTLT